MVKALTSKQVKSTVAVDYHKVELANCNKKRLRELIEGEAGDAKSPLARQGGGGGRGAVPAARAVGGDGLTAQTKGWTLVL
eukprot:COSAG04_NODE_205_length_20393_cov_45.275796_14_plen_81_part_00